MLLNGAVHKLKTVLLREAVHRQKKKPYVLLSEAVHRLKTVPCY